MSMIRDLLQRLHLLPPPPNNPPPATESHPSGPSVPISFPIKDLDYLHSRSYFDSFHYPFNVASVPLPDHAVPQPDRPRLLVCHDMAGGYGDDRWIQGGSNPDAYSLWHWYLMDVFVYFSHNIVTLPPPCWTNAAHRHGVKVLGTFLLEWDEGRVNANKLLSTKDLAKEYAERLAELAKTLNFDGWLLNMEVRLSPEKIPTLKVFISHLTQTMHASVPGSLVLWYDSVTKDGNLAWQNQLNATNKPFFDLCDGMFTNYFWQEDYPKTSANVAGDRKHDVYMGIDVFGRNTFGGGKWNTNVALDVLKKDDISAAIFAPGWVYENKEPPNFETAQNRWWGLVEKSWGILRHYPNALPFFANFNKGQGYHFSVDGSQVIGTPWNNISWQQIQPLYDSYTGPDGTPIAIFIEPKGESYSGGGNFTFRGNILDDAILTTRIFSAKISLEGPIHISFAVRSDMNSSLGLGLEFFSETNGRTSILVVDNGSSIHTDKFDKVVTPSQLKISMDKQAWVVYQTEIEKGGYMLTEIFAVCCLKRLDRKEEIALEGRKFLKEVPSNRDSSSFDASLGYLSIKYTSQIMDFPPSDAWLAEFQDIAWSSGASGSRTLNAKIIWRLGVELGSPFGSYNIYVEKLTARDANVSAEGVKEFIGAATLEMYYVSNLEVPVGTSALRFTIQACASDGSCQKVGEAPTFYLSVVD